MWKMRGQRTTTSKYKVERTSFKENDTSDRIGHDSELSDIEDESFGVRKTKTSREKHPTAKRDKKMGKCLYFLDVRKSQQYFFFSF